MPAVERRADKARREEAERLVGALKLGDEWGKPSNAGNGRIRLKHECGATVEGNKFSLFAIVHNGAVVSRDLPLKAAVAGVEEIAQSIKDAAARAKKEAQERFDALPDEEKAAIIAKRQARALEEVKKAEAKLDEAKAAAAALNNSGGPSPIKQAQPDNRKPTVKSKAKKGK